MNKKLILALTGIALCGTALAGPLHVDAGTLDRHHHGHRRHWCPDRKSVV